MSGPSEQTGRAIPASGEGLHPPSRYGTAGKVLWWVRFAVFVQLMRLRFLFILLAIGLVIVKWDLLSARYEQWMHAKETDVATGDVEYFCPMHPNIIRDNNKEKCPICAMPLSRRKKGLGGDQEVLPAGIVSRVQLSPYRIVLAGVKTVPVSYQQVTKEISTIGSVEFAESGLKNVASRVKGRIDELFVNETGQLVKTRQPLASIYSADLVVTVENLLNARKAGNTEMEANAVDRLKRWGIDDEEIKKIVADNKPITHLTIRSPIDGHILKKYVREGQYVEEGSSLYDVADISTVWVQGQLYEDDLAFLPKWSHDPKTGRTDKKLKAIATARAFPGKQFEGTLSLVFPHLDPDSRTLTVRFELENKQHELRPGMTMMVHLNLDANSIAELPAGRGLILSEGKVLAVPEQCIIDTGAQKIVYREELPGTYEGVEVELGPRLSGPNKEVLYAVLKGLNPNDQVVTNGSFLIDAETRLNHAVGSTYIGSNSSDKNSTAPVRPSTPEDSASKIRAAMQQLSPSDRSLAMAQKYCPVQQTTQLGEMDRIIKIELDGKPVFLCCKSCIKDAMKDPAGTLARIDDLRKKANAAPKKTDAPPMKNSSE